MLPSNWNLVEIIKYNRIVTLGLDH